MLGDRSEAGAAVCAQRSLVPRCDPEPEPLRRPLGDRVAKPGLDELRAEPAPGEIGANAEPDAYLVALAHEVEEPDQLAVVRDDRAQTVPPRRIRE